MPPVSTAAVGTAAAGTGTAAAGGGGLMAGLGKFGTGALSFAKANPEITAAGMELGGDMMGADDEAGKEELNEAQAEQAEAETEKLEEETKILHRQNQQTDILGDPKIAAHLNAPGITTAGHVAGDVGKNIKSVAQGEGLQGFSEDTGLAMINNVAPGAQARGMVNQTKMIQNVVFAGMTIAVTRAALQSQFGRMALKRGVGARALGGKKPVAKAAARGLGALAAAGLSKKKSRKKLPKLRKA